VSHTRAPFLGRVIQIHIVELTTTQTNFDACKVTTVID
jgi:hypothetical protein